MRNSSDTIHPDLLAAQRLMYEPAGLSCGNFVKEAESEEYGAFSFEMGHRSIKFRVAKITPTKIGQFVTLWKRTGNGPIQPYDSSDPIDFFVVSVRNANRFGQFVFPKSVLCEQGVVSKEGKGGKRAIRVYPAWDITDSRQAKKTQEWQLKYFFEIKPNVAIDATSVQKLFTGCC